MNALTLAKSQEPVHPALECGLKLLPSNVARVLAAHEDRAAVMAECRDVMNAEGPASEAQLAVQIERMALHYPESRLSEGAQLVVMRDWLRLLGHLPADIIAASVDRYILSPARFFPTPGQFNEIADGLWRYRRMLAARAREVVAIIENQVSA